MTDRELDTNEAILAELKKMNNHLAHIRAAADNYMRVQQARENAFQDMQANLPRLGG